MAGTVKMTLPDGRIVDGVDVAVDSSNERWSEVTFTDGTTMRLKMTVLSVQRAVDTYDLQGNPIYTLNMTPVVVMGDVGAGLRKKGN